MSNIILLGGKSVKDAINYPELNDERNTVYAINRKSGIEEFLNLEVDVWVLFCDVELREQLEEVREFLSRKRENRLIISDNGLEKIRNEIRVKPLPNPDRIILIDSYYNKRNINSLAALLQFLKIADPASRNYLFGCDGLAKKEEKDIYFRQENLSEARIAKNNIYYDMVVFQDNYLEIVGDLFVRNMNVNSYYDKIPYADKIETIPTDILATNKLSTSDLLIIMEQIHNRKFSEEFIKNIYETSLMKRIIKRIKRRFKKLFIKRK